LLAWPTRLRFEHNTINQSLDNTNTSNYMLSMTDTDNVVSFADWKAKHQRKSDQAQRVSVYVPVRDPDGRWRLELIGTTTLDLDVRVDPSSTR
jgi:hypothetical protein